MAMQWGTSIGSPHSSGSVQQLLSLPEKLHHAVSRKDGATVFGYWVKDPERYGIACFNETGKVSEIVEKPTQPKSNWAVTGLYFYDNRILDISADLKPSARGELEITDVNRIYMDMEELHVEKLGRGFAWLDTGTHESLLDASNYIETLEKRQGLKISCVEEIAYRMGYIDVEQLHRLAKPMKTNEYGKYLVSIAKSASKGQK